MLGTWAAMSWPAAAIQPQLARPLSRTGGSRTRRLTDDAARNVTIIRAPCSQTRARTAGSELASLRLALARLAVDADIVLDCHCDSESLLHLFLIPAHWPTAADLSAEIGSRATLLSEESGGYAFDETFSTPWTRLARALPDKPVPPPVCPRPSNIAARPTSATSGPSLTPARCSASSSAAASGRRPRTLPQAQCEATARRLRRRAHAGGGHRRLQAAARRHGDGRHG